MSYKKLSQEQKIRELELELETATGVRKSFVAEYLELLKRIASYRFRSEMVNNNSHSILRDLGIE